MEAWFALLAALWSMFKIVLSLVCLVKFVNAWKSENVIDAIGYGVLFLGLQRG